MFTNLSNVANSLPVARTVPLQPISLTDRTQNMYIFDQNYVIPYVQNFNLELQRELGKDLSLDVRYVGTKGTQVLIGTSNAKPH